MKLWKASQTEKGNYGPKNTLLRQIYYTITYMSSSSRAIYFGVNSKYVVGKSSIHKIGHWRYFLPHFAICITATNELTVHRQSICKDTKKTKISSI